MNFEISDLRAFVATADLGSFRAAADTLHLSASALSRRIEKLEEVLGVRLFERTTRKMDLTIVGRGFLERAHRILNEVDNSMLEFDDLARKMTGELTVACVPSAVRYFLPEAIATYHQRYPGIRLRLIDEPSSMVFLAVARGEADFGLTYVGTEEPDIEFTPLLEDPFVLACPRSHPLAKRKSVAWAELANLEYLAIAQGSGNRAVIDEALAGVADRPKWFCEVRHVPALVSLIEAGGCRCRAAARDAPRPAQSPDQCRARRSAHPANAGGTPASRPRFVLGGPLLPSVVDGNACARSAACQLYCISECRRPDFRRHGKAFVRIRWSGSIRAHHAPINRKYAFVA